MCILTLGRRLATYPSNTVSLQSWQKSISQVHFWDKMDLCPSLVQGSPLWQLTRKVGRDSSSSTHQARVAPRPQKSPNCRTLWSLESANWIILGDFAASFPGNRPLIYFTHACNPCLTMCSHTKVGTLRRTLNSCVDRDLHQLQIYRLLPFSTSALEGAQSLPPFTLKAVSNKLGACGRRGCAKKLIRLIGQKCVVTRKKCY